MATSHVWREQAIDLAEAEHFRLGRAEVRPSLLQISVGGELIPVEPGVMRMLVALHDAGGATVTKHQLIEQCWGGLAISDDAITQCISKLRRVLGRFDDVEVETVQRLGYRLAETDVVTNRLSGTRQWLLSRRSTLAGGLTAVAACAGAFAWLRPARSTAETIAVLPFANLSGDPAQAYFSDGIAEEVRSALGRIAGLQVIGRTSSEAVRRADAKIAADRLHAGAVLTGSVRRSPTAIRVAVQLVDGRTGIDRWSDSYDFAPGDALRLQSDIAESVAAALSVSLGVQAGQLTIGGTRNVAALDLYLQAKHALEASDTLATVRQVVALCDAAIGLDARYGSAFALKAMALNTLGGNFASDVDMLRAAYGGAEEAARRAITIAPRLATGYVALAVSLTGSLKTAPALREYRRAEQLSPGGGSFLDRYARLLAEIGRMADSVAVAERLIALDPLNAYAHGARGFIFYYARRYADAVESLEQALRIAPGITQHRNLLGDCLLLLGKTRDARAAYALTPEDDPFRLTGEAIASARSGDSRSMRLLLGRMDRMYGDAASFQIAQIHAQLGAFDEAFMALERGRSVLDPGLNALPTDPFIDPLRSDERFGPLLRSLDLP